METEPTGKAKGANHENQGKRRSDGSRSSARSSNAIASGFSISAVPTVLPTGALLSKEVERQANTTVSLIIDGLHGRRRDTAGPAPRSRRGVGTSSRWSRGRAGSDGGQ